mgnify:FL=1
MPKEVWLMAKEFNLKITTCDRSFYSGPCESIVLPAIDGEHGVLADHEPMVTAIVSGECRFTANGKQNIIAVGQGFAEIKPEQVEVIVDTAEYPEEIDARRAEEAKIRAEEAMRQKQSILEYNHSQAALSRAMTRLKVKGR